MKNPYDVIKTVRVTEKGTAQTEKHNRYQVVVEKHANKLDIKHAVEKAFKGAITLHDVEVPKTHDVVRLRAALLELGTASPLQDAEVQALLPYAVDDRYPRLTLSAVSRADALELLPVAERAVAWLDGLLGAM